MHHVACPTLEPFRAGEFTTPPRKSGGVLVDGSGQFEASARPRRVSSARAFPRVPAPCAALLVLELNLGVRGQPGRLPSDHRRQSSQALALFGCASFWTRQAAV